jgi:hypothetical protein
MAEAHPFGAFVRCRFKRIGCVRTIKFIALDKLIMTVYSVRMPVGFVRGIKSKGRPL